MTVPVFDALTCHRMHDAAEAIGDLADQVADELPEILDRIVGLDDEPQAVAA